MPVGWPGVLIDNRTKQDGNRKSTQPYRAAAPCGGAPRRFSYNCKLCSGHERKCKSPQAWPSGACGRPAV